jgi:hypothetical protein
LSKQIKNLHHSQFKPLFASTRITILRIDDLTRTYLKNLDQGSGLPLMRDFASDYNISMPSKGAARRKRGAYTAVCEHFEPIRNSAHILPEHEHLNAFLK